MYANWVRETTTTTGTGTLTLSAVTNYPRVSDVASDQQQFAYCILNDSDGTPIEAGIGRYVSSNQFARDIITATYSGGVYDNTAPAAISLAAGTKRLILTPTANSIGAALPSIDGVSSGPKKYIWSNHGAFDLQAKTIVADTQYYTPFLLEANIEISHLAVYVGTAAVSGKGRAAIMSIKNGYPDTVLCETGDITITVGSTWTETALSANKRLPPGWYCSVIVGSQNFGTLGYNGGSARHVRRCTPFGFDSTNRDRSIACRYHTVTGGWSAVQAVNATSSSFTVNSDYAPAVALVSA